MKFHEKLEDVEVGDLVFLRSGYFNTSKTLQKVVGVTKTLIKTENGGRYRIKDGYPPSDDGFGRNVIFPLTEKRLQEARLYAAASNVSRCADQLNRLGVEGIIKGGATDQELNDFAESFAGLLDKIEEAGGKQ